MPPALWPLTRYVHYERSYYHVRAAGDFQLLTAIYDYRSDFPRVRIELPDGTTGTEAVVSGFTIGR